MGRRDEAFAAMQQALRYVLLSYIYILQLTSLIYDYVYSCMVTYIHVYNIVIKLQYMYRSRVKGDKRTGLNMY